MKYVVDIDGTICDWEPGREYSLAHPNRDRIAKLNQLYDEGHHITYLTARGMGRYDGARIRLARFYGSVY